MKRFEIKLIVHDGDKILSLDRDEADSLAELMAKLLLIVVRVQSKEERKKEYIDDDIPF